MTDREQIEAIKKKIEGKTVNELAIELDGLAGLLPVGAIRHEILFRARAIVDQTAESEQAS